jgi:hypothetical protein
MFGDNIEEEVLFYPDVEENESRLIESIQESQDSRLEDAMDFIIDNLD